MRQERLRVSGAPIQSGIRVTKLGVWLPDRPEFQPTSGADGWQLSDPPILALAPLRVSLKIFRHSGVPTLREKLLQLTGYPEWLVQTRLADMLQVITLAEPKRRGA